MASFVGLHVGNAGWIGFGKRLTIGPKTGTRIDERTKRAHLLRNALLPFQSAKGERAVNNCHQLG